MSWSLEAEKKTQVKFDGPLSLLYGRLSVIRVNAAEPDEPRNANTTQSLIDV